MREVILHISAGQGPGECRWVVANLARVFAKEANSQRLQCELLEQADEKAASLLLSITGDGCENFAAERVGTIRWIGNSPFRPRHKRKNWYVGVGLAPSPGDTPELKEGDIKYQAIRASGPGGQHVNKTDSAVRATHEPTGLSVVSQEQRSQFANKKIARLKLALAFEERRRSSEASAKTDLWEQNRDLERGNEVRCYEGVRFVLR